MGLSVSRLLQGLFGKKEMRQSQLALVPPSDPLLNLTPTQVFSWSVSMPLVKQPFCTSSSWARSSRPSPRSVSVFLLYRDKPAAHATESSIFFQASMWRQLNTRISHSRYGMWEGRIRFDRSGGTVCFHMCHPSLILADFQNTQGIIFVVDSNDRERITEAREECESSCDL